MPGMQNDNIAKSSICKLVNLENSKKDEKRWKMAKKDGDTEFRCRQWDGEMMYMGLYIEYIMYIKGIVYNIPAISENKMKDCKILFYSLCKVIIVE